MAKTIAEGFATFLSSLTPNTGESNAAKSHRQSIYNCLKSNFEITRFFRMGSFGNGTSISGYSDVDYLATVPTKYLKQDSTSTLRVVKDVLDARFPLTGVKVNTPAICIPFGKNYSETTEIVPADLVEYKPNKLHVYEIADGDGGWMKASPDSHNAYVTYTNTKLNNKVKPLIRFIKAWKYYWNVPISSFYLELRITNYAANEQTIVYDMDILAILGLLSRIELASMQDPMKVSGYIKACKTEAQRQDALSKLSSALGRVQKAIQASESNKIEEAFYWWSLFYNERFPSYR